MTQSPSFSTQAVLEQLSTRRRQRLRKNVQLMFLGMSAEEAEQITHLLRASRLAPRGHLVSSEQEFLAALSERSWDVILCTADQTDFTPKNAMHHLRRLDKDIPVIQLVPNSDSHYMLQGLKNNIQAVVPLEEKELLIIHMRRELESLEGRRKLRQTEAELSNAEKQTEYLLDSSMNAIACCDGDTIVYANQSLASLLGFESPDTLVGTSLSLCFSPGQKDKLQEQLTLVKKDNLRHAGLQLTGVRADETVFDTDITLRPARHNNNPCIQISLSAACKEEEELQERLDLVSGLYNPGYFNSKLDDTLQRALSGGADCNLLYISLDNYLEIRSEIGIEGCDQIIRDISTLLKKHVNKAHILARPEEDGFAVIYYDPSPDKAVTLANKLCKAIEGNISESSNTIVQTTGSIGIATISDSTPGRKVILERVRSAADSIRAENQRGNGVSLYQPKEQAADETTELIFMLEEAIQQKNMKLLFQPIVALNSQKVTNHHYETFLRLLDKNGNETSPGAFMETLEEADISIKVDRWVIKESMLQLQREFRRNQRNRIFINLCSRTLRDKKTLLWLSELLRKAGLPADHLVFQISETDALVYLKHAKFFSDTLHKLHCKVCIKHYGNSLNSELVLKQINPDYVKLDGAYIQALNEAGSDNKKVLKLLHALKVQNKITIAPLVGGTRVMGTLWKAGVDFVQGNYLQPPKASMDYDFFDS
ncbi:MAG: EAL domain-containing protein [Pontibacterium sp.]